MHKVPKFTKDSLKQSVSSQNLSLSVAFTTRDISSITYLRQLIHKGASYQVISSTHHPFLYNSEDILLGVIPLTK